MFTAHGKKTSILNEIINIKHDLDNRKWEFEVDNESDFFDFDKMFERYRDEGKLPELFDEIIDILTQILHSGDVESRYVIDALKKLIGTLKQSKSGSFFSMNTAWEFLCDFAENYIWDQFASVTGLSAFSQTLREKMKEANIEMVALTKKTNESVRNEVGDDLSAYSKVNRVPQIRTYGNNGVVALEGESSRIKEEA